LIAISELAWCKKEAPQEIRDYFNKEHRNKKYFKKNYPIIESVGYKETDYHPLSDRS